VESYAQASGESKAIDLERFSRVCGMLGSAFDGERAAAAETATRMLREAGLTWAELLEPLAKGTPDKAQSMDGVSAFALVHSVYSRLHFGKCSDWDKAFVSNLVELADRFGEQMRLSPKQWAQLRRIAGLVGVGGGQ
jgi:hypothetical protein